MSQTKVELGLDVKALSTITTADNTDTLTLTSTDADATTGPVLNFFRNSGSPADNDNIGFIRATGKNDASQDVDYTNIYNSIVDASDGTEDGAYEIYNMVAGTLRSKVKMVPTETVFNEDSRDIDFRVETDSQTHGLFVDAGNNMVGVNNSTYDNAQFKVQQDTADRLIARFEHHPDRDWETNKP